MLFVCLFVGTRWRRQKGMGTSAKYCKRLSRKERSALKMKKEQLNKKQKKKINNLDGTTTTTTAFNKSNLTF